LIPILPCKGERIEQFVRDAKMMSAKPDLIGIDVTLYFC